MNIQAFSHKGQRVYGGQISTSAATEQNNTNKGKK
jgi:hypothetical protein